MAASWASEGDDGELGLRTYFKIEEFFGPNSPEENASNCRVIC
jgi:hypothetical protein